MTTSGRQHFLAILGDTEIHLMSSGPCGRTFGIEPSGYPKLYTVLSSYLLVETQMFSSLYIQTLHWKPSWLQIHFFLHISFYTFRHSLLLIANTFVPGLPATGTVISTQDLLLLSTHLHIYGLNTTF